MQYYEVLVADSSYKGTAALTYQYFETLPIGQIVYAPLRSKQVLGVITRRVSKPRFTAKPLSPANNIRPLPEQLSELAVWMTTYYPAGIGVTLQQFLPSKLYGQDDLNKARSDASSGQGLPDDAMRPELPGLTDEQQAAIKTLVQPGTHILHGETGSGKTRVYIELARRSFEQKKSSIVMTPEIGLTPQLVNNFRAAFGADHVVLTHSKLTAKERNLAWLRMLQSDEPLIVLGPRSALFSPVSKLNTIILDEAHEGSYKQEQAPHYHAGTVAAKLASMHGASVVLGSATPSINDYYIARAKGRPIVRMVARAHGPAVADESNPAPGGVAIDIIDLKDRSKFSRQPHLATTLLQSIQAGMQRGEQSLVFLNRRGTARVILCENAAGRPCARNATYR